MPAAFKDKARTTAPMWIAGLIAAVGWFGLAYGAHTPPSRLPDPAPSMTDESHTVEPSAGPQPSAILESSASPNAPSHDEISRDAESASATAGKSKAQPAEILKLKTPRLKLKELRAETVKWIESIDATASAGGDAPAKTAAPDANPVEDPKALRALLKTRLDWMSEYEKAEQDYRQATTVDPEQDGAKAKAELEKLNAMLVQAAQAPNTLLPQVFRGSLGEVGDSARTEMKEAIESTRNELKDWTTKYEAAKANATKTTEVQAAMRAERDKIFQRVAALKTRVGEQPQAASKTAKAPVPDTPRLDRERRLNAEWETRVESLRLKAQEARIALEAKLKAVSELDIQVDAAHVRLAQQILDQMQQRFRSASDLQQRDLKRAAASEENLAANADDPLVRYRARRNAELLEMEAQTVKFEQRLTSNDSPSLEEQRTLMNRAKKEFENLKQLLNDGDVSRLDAILLNNDFRRIGPERDRIERNELKTVEARVQFYGNALTEAQLELIEDARLDQFEHEALLERLPPERRAAAGLVFDEIEGKHRAILVRRRDALKALAARAAETLKEVKSRIAVLDDEYGFIRTSIFWVRDQDPIGPESLRQGGREVARLGKATFRLAGEAVDSRNWSRVSAEFTAAAVGLVVLPFGLFRVRRRLGDQIAIHLPAPGAVPEPIAPTSDPDSTMTQPPQPEPD